MAHKVRSAVEQELEDLRAEAEAKHSTTLEILLKRPETHNLTDFVAENINNEAEIPDFGTDPDDFTLKTIENVPIVRNVEELDGQKVQDFTEEITPVMDELMRQQVENNEKKRRAMLPSHVREHVFPILDEYNTAELVELLRRVRARLPATKLKDLNLEEELVLHFLNLKELMTLVLYDDEVPANQKAQIANSCAGLLQQMTKQQTTLYSAERVKRMETALLKALHGLPQEVLEKFLERYEDVYEADS